MRDDFRKFTYSLQHGSHYTISWMNTEKPFFIHQQRRHQWEMSEFMLLSIRMSTNCADTRDNDQWSNAKAPRDIRHVRILIFQVKIPWAKSLTIVINECCKWTCHLVDNSKTAISFLFTFTLIFSLFRIKERGENQASQKLIFQR